MMQQAVEQDKVESRIGWRVALLAAAPVGVVIQVVPALVGLYFGAAAGFAAVRLFLLLAVLLLGLYVMHALSRVREGAEISERVVMQELALEALRTVNHLSSIGGVIGGVFSFARVSQWRRDGRRARDDTAG